jgi:hypothetical protein
MKESDFNRFQRNVPVFTKNHDKKSVINFNYNISRYSVGLWAG